MSYIYLNMLNYNANFKTLLSKIESRAKAFIKTRPYLTYDIVISEAYLSIVKALNSYKNQYDFNTYIDIKVSYAFKEVNRSLYRSNQARFESNLYFINNANDKVIYNEDFDNKIFIEQLFSKINISDRDFNITSMYYIEGYTMEDIANKYNVNTSRISQILSDVKYKLRNAIDNL